MTKATRKARAKTKLTDDQKWGAIEFEPWTKEALEKSVPVSNKKWNEIGSARLPIVRTAWIMLGKTKEELKDIIVGLDKKTDFDLLEEIGDGIYFFKRYAEILECARSRLLVAGSALLAEGKLAD